METNYQFRGALIQKMCEGPPGCGGFTMDIPIPFSGEIILGNSLKISTNGYHGFQKLFKGNSNNYQEVQGNLDWTSTFWRDDFRNQEVHGIMKGLDLLIMAGFPSGDYKPPIYLFPMRVEEHSTYMLGTTIDDIPHDADEMYIFAGKFYSWTEFFKGKPDNAHLREELNSGNGTGKYFEVILQKLDKLEQRAKKNKASKDELTTDLDLILFK